MADPSGRSFLTVRCNGTDRDERVQKRGEPNHHDGNRDGLKCFSAGGLQQFVRSAPASAFPLIDPRTQGKKPSALKVATPPADAGGANSLPKNPVGAVAAPLSRASPLVSAIATENFGSSTCSKRRSASQNYAAGPLEAEGGRGTGHRCQCAD